MCTLIVHVSRKLPPALLLGANRDEAYDRPSAGPALLSAEPRVWGGRDLEAGGTWLAAHLDLPHRLVAVLNGEEVAGGDPHASTGARGGHRSRGLLCLAVASAENFDAVKKEFSRQIRDHGSAPFNLFVAESDSPFLFLYDGTNYTMATLARRWHAITHGDPDDPGDPRVAHALGALEGVEPSVEALARVLSGHDGPGAACRHGERYGTVSSTIVEADLDTGRFVWRYAAGPPCRSPYVLTSPPAAY